MQCSVLYFRHLFGTGTVGNCLAIHMYAFIRIIQRHYWSVMHHSVEAIRKKIYHRQGKVVHLISHISSICLWHTIRLYIVVDFIYD